MARIVLVSSHPSERTALRAALLHSATGPAAATLEVVALDRLTALEALLMRARPDSYQAAVVCGNEATLSALLPTLQARHPRLLVALASHNAQEAAGETDALDYDDEDAADASAELLHALVTAHLVPELDGQARAMGGSQTDAS